MRAAGPITNEVRATLPPVEPTSRDLFGRLVDFLLGHDVFISYAWADGRRYAERLFRVLSEIGLSAFLDDERMHAGAKLRSTLRRALRSSTVLIVIVTEEVLASGHVANEVRAFAQSDRNIIPIVPPNLVETIRTPPEQAPDLPDDATTAPVRTIRAYLMAALHDRIWVQEDVIADSDPSDRVITKVRNTVGAFRRIRIRVAILAMSVVVFLIIAVAALVLRGVASSNEQTAISRQLAAQSVATKDEQLDRSLLLALAADDVKSTKEARQALHTALVNGPPISAYLREHDQPVMEIEPLSNGGFVTADFGGNLVHFDAAGSVVAGATLETRQPVEAMISRSDGTLLVGDFAGVVWILDSEDLTVRDQVFSDQFANSAAHIAWRENKRELIVGYTGGDIVAWTRPADDAGWSGRLIGQVGTSIISMAGSPDGRLLAVGTDSGTILLLEAEAPDQQPRVRTVATLLAARPEAYIKGLAFDSSGQRLAFDDAAGGVNIVSLETFADGPSSLCHRHTNDVYEITFAGTDVVSVGSDGRLRVAEGSNGCTGRADYQVTAKSLQSVALLSGPALQLATGSGDGTVLLWNLDKSGVVGETLADDVLIPVSAAFSPDDKTLLVAGVTGKPGPGSGFARAYDARTLAPRGQRAANVVGPITEIIDTGHPTMLSQDALIRWPDVDAPSTEVVWRPKQPAVGWPGQVFAPAAGRLVRAESDGTVTVFDLASGNVIWERGDVLQSAAGGVRSAAISPDGTKVAVGSNNGPIELLNGVTGDQMGEPLDMHTLEVTALHFSNDSSRLYTGSTDGQILAWDLKTRVPRHIENTFGSIQQIAVSGDENLIAAATQRGIVALWSDGGRTLSGTMGDNLPTAVTVLQFDGAGTRLAAATMADGVHKARIAAWDVEEASWQRIACQIAARPLSDEERSQFGVPDGVDPCHKD